ncbi:hypothetical protein [Sulfitobacter sediminilitoris]|jgi:hypothetical protein|nr:hypothetical protein [Sulfitobacter sediminilitoris]
MRAMITAFVAVAVIAVGANIILDNVGFSSQDRSSSNAVRLD